MRTRGAQIQRDLPCRHAAKFIVRMGLTGSVTARQSETGPNQQELLHGIADSQAWPPRGPDGGDGLRVALSLGAAMDAAQAKTYLVNGILSATPIGYGFKNLKKKIPSSSLFLMVSGLEAGQIRKTIADDIRKRHAANPDEQFVLAGISKGADVVLEIAQDVAKDNIPIAYLAIVEGNGGSVPANVQSADNFICAKPGRIVRAGQGGRRQHDPGRYRPYRHGQQRSRPFARGCKRQIDCRTDQPLSRSRRPCSRFQSRSLSCSRLSCGLRPLASAICSFATPRSLKIEPVRHDRHAFAVNGAGKLRHLLLVQQQFAAAARIRD